ncbi:MAG: hypothetical protein PWR13_1088 [Archaeoglobi archaeon]|nr:hypothetical protein [Archaeoglobi archaeon]
MAQLGSFVGAAIGVVIITIVVLNVALPVVTDAIQSSNLTGTSSTIANLIPLFLVLGVFLAVVGAFIINWL